MLSEQELEQKWSEKISLMQQFIYLTGELKKAYEAADMQGFEAALVRREKVIAKVDDLDTIIARQWQEDRDTEAVQGLRLKLRQLLESARELNGEVAAGLEQGQGELLQNLNQLHSARQADKVYSKKSRQVEGYFVDRKK